MARRGRPRSSRKAVIVQIKLRLYGGEDDDLIAFFSAIPAGLRATMVKQALQDGVGIEGDDTSSSDDTLLDALEAFVI